MAFLVNEHAHPVEEEWDNLALRQGVRISCNVMRPSGGGARDPHILLNDAIYSLDGQSFPAFGQSTTYDTYDGQNRAAGPDWYTIEFPDPVTVNCIEMTMGLPYRDGGWWTSLAVEARAGDHEAWHPVTGLDITPPYCFDDRRGERRPFETHALLFDDVTAQALRVIGQPGGLAQFTSLARLAVYHRDLSRWNRASLPEPPMPHIFKLISPQTVWDLSESLVKLTGLIISAPFVEYYLDEARYRQFWERIGPIYEGEPNLWFLVGDAMGWDAWSQMLAEEARRTPVPTEPHVRVCLHNTLAQAVAPVIVEGQIIGEMSTDFAVLMTDSFDWAWHQRHAQERNIPWPAYQAAIERSPHMMLDRLEAVADLLGMIANTIANLMHHNLRIGRELAEAQENTTARAQRKEIVRRAIDLMQSKLEDPIGVAEVAQAMALSPAYFCALFREETGRNPREFLIDLRLARAKEYLAHTPMSVLDVCTALGYTPSYFTRLFRQRTGCTPGEYARRMRAR